MWQHNLDALMDVQANVKDALADRGLSEAEIAIRDAKPTVPGEGIHIIWKAFIVIMPCCGGVLGELSSMRL